MSSKTLSASQLKKFRSDVAKLKSKGLVSARVDARAQKPTRHMREQVKKFEDVLSGRAKVVHTPKRSQAKEYADAFRVKGKSVVVPVEKGETVRFNKSSGKIVGTRRAYGKTIKKEYYTKRLDSVKDLPQGKGILYSVPLGNGLRSFDDLDDLANFMFPYETQARNPYLDWQKYVIVERLRSRERAERMSDDDDIAA
jgi:hypothetical protein